MKNKTVLVTGGTGFVGIHTILQLLQKGYNIKTTLRSISKKDIIINALKEGGISDFEKLQFLKPIFLMTKAGMRPWKVLIMSCTSHRLFPQENQKMKTN